MNLDHDEKKKLSAVMRGPVAVFFLWPEVFPIPSSPPHRDVPIK